MSGSDTKTIPLSQRSDTKTIPLSQRSDTNSIESYETNDMSQMNPLPPAHRAVGLLNSFGVPSFSPDSAVFFLMPEVTTATYEKRKKILKKYCQAVKQALIKGIILAKQQQLNEELIPVSFSELRKSCGRYGANGKGYWFDFFQEHSPLLIKVKEGYKFGRQGTLTMVKTTIDINLILANQDSKQMIRSMYAGVDPDRDIDYAPIDLVSLNHYISANKVIQQRNNTLDENLKLAKTILLIATEMGGVLPQIISESTFGRRYYRGINLQSAAKIVRHAALGECHQYDIEASVFTWKLDTVKEIDPNCKLPATIDYLEFKQHHRLRLSNLIFGSEDHGYQSAVKRAITAIGFGARKTNAVWMNDRGSWCKTALRQIIYSQELLDQFLQDPWVSEFIQEQELMNRLIWEEIKDTRSIVEDPELKNKNNQISKNRAIAKAYQCFERSLLTALESLVEDKTVLLKCHDGFYTKQRCNLSELRELVKQFLPNGRLDHIEHQGYKFIDENIESNHKQHMEREKAQARKYAENNGLDCQEGNGRLPYRPYSSSNEDFDNGHRGDYNMDVYEQLLEDEE
jgi:hypothetical protein